MMRSTTHPLGGLVGGGRGAAAGALIGGAGGAVAGAATTPQAPQQPAYDAPSPSYGQAPAYYYR